MGVSLKSKMAAGSHFECRRDSTFDFFVMSEGHKTQIQCQKLLHLHVMRVSTKGTGFLTGLT